MIKKKLINIGKKSKKALSFQIDSKKKNKVLKDYIKLIKKNKKKIISQNIKDINHAKKKGITKIICISVNDPNVMKAWGESQNVENKIFMAADPYCEFTKSIGADIDRFDRGQGMRSARYTMLVENNIATKIKAEEDTAICEMSAAENFLDSI